ncbi:MAG: degradosome polyphosphate kinase [Ignavibacteria bacterium]|nr:degradosome polyphosphate kinase [Ignavibacteria bacterium]
MSRNNNNHKNSHEWDSTKNFFNREIGFIEFNKRVLAEAEDKSHPLLERLKFVSIFSSNLDEFFMIRVAGLKGQVASGVIELSYDGMTPEEQLSEIRRQLLPALRKQEMLVNEDILPALESEGIIIHRFETLTKDEIETLQEFFCESVLPVLTPHSLDPAHPFPQLLNRSLNIAFVLKDKTKTPMERKVAFLQVPPVLQRFVKLERKKGHHYVLIEAVIKAFAHVLFPGLEIDTSNTFQVTRDADLEIAEDEAEDLLDEIAEQIKHRRWGTDPVRLEVSSNMSDSLVKLLRNSLDLEPGDVYVLNRPLNLPDFMELVKLDIRHLKDKPFSTRPLPEFLQGGTSIFRAISKQDLMVYHPYDSFSNSTLKFINTAADDPDVLAIKITLYRTGSKSAIVAALKRAAENRKQVMAFVELKARFDEENNIIWAKELEKAGVYVVYGILGLKTHCKIAMIVRREGSKMKTYLHLSTGNYNQVTARLYTDIGFFTAREEFTVDAIHLFNYLTGYSYHKDWKRLSVAPINLRDNIIEMIRREAKQHTPENPGLIIAKMNSLVHKQVIPELYKASQKGVKIQLLVRGLCCLRPGILGLSENIEVRSILGRFLEHSRIFYFKNAGDEEFYLSSADWMSRNLNNRVELMFPVLDEQLQRRLWDILQIHWRENTKSWKLEADGSYTKIHKSGEKPFCAQDYFLDEIKSSRADSGKTKIKLMNM